MRKAYNKRTVHHYRASLFQLSACTGDLHNTMNGLSNNVSNPSTDDLTVQAIDN